MSLQLASEFLAKNQTCVIATMSKDDKPEAATVGYSHDDKYTFLIGTDISSRKYKNLIANPSIALVVGFEGTETVQFEGEAKEISAENAQDRIQKHLEKVPDAKRFADNPGQSWFVITPTWLRHTNYSQTTPIFETKDFA